jgi:hypothetical protein
MGTRSLTKIIEKYDDNEEQVLTTMYRQYDGYMSGHGVDLAEWLSKFSVVNGISLDEEIQVANGTDCLAAQMFAHFKNGAGGIYLMHPDAHDCGEEYIYYIYVHHDDITIKVYDTYSEKVIFEGTPKKFLTIY